MKDWVRKGDLLRNRFVKRPAAGKARQSFRTVCLTVGLSLLASVFVLFAKTSDPASAGILSKLLREAGEAGGKAGKHGIGGLDNAAGALKKLPDGESALALAAHQTPEGHWVFRNKKGDQFTAGTPDELARAPQALLGTNAGAKPLSLYLSEDTIFQSADNLAALPSNAKLHMVVGRKSFALKRRSDPSQGLVARVRPNLTIALSDKAMLGEALYRLGRPLNAANVRLLALKPGGPRQLSSVPAYDPATRRRLAEAADPNGLHASLRKLKGQTVIVTGEVKQGKLYFQPAEGPAGTISLSDLSEAAQVSDVSLIVLRSNSPIQPGAKTWLWQTTEVSGLDDALKRQTYADFLQSLTANSGDLLLEAKPGRQGRLVLTARPATGVSSGSGGGIGGWIDVLSQQVTGSIATNGITAYTRNKETEREYALRLLPGIPFNFQIMYGIGLFAGLMGLGVARGWWQGLWPPEDRLEYRNAIGYQLARVARGMAFVILFLPVIGIFALIWTYLRPVLMIVMAPFRFVGRFLWPTRS